MPGKSPPRNAAEATSQPKAGTRKGAQSWSAKREKSGACAGLAHEKSFPGSAGFTPGRCEAIGSRKTTDVRETKLGTSVRWKHELKPRPKRPVLLPCESSRLRLSPMRWIAWKSRSLKAASL